MWLDDAKRPLISAHGADAEIGVRPRDRETRGPVDALHHADETIGRHDGEERLHTGIGTGRQGHEELVRGTARRKDIGWNKSIAQPR